MSFKEEYISYWLEQGKTLQEATEMFASKEAILQEEKEYYYETVKSAREEYIYYCVKHGKTLEEAKKMAYSKERYPEVHTHGDSIIFHEIPAFWAIWDVYGDKGMNDPVLLAEAKTILPTVKTIENLSELGIN